MAPSPTKYRKSGFSDVAALRITFATSIGLDQFPTLGPQCADPILYKFCIGRIIFVISGDDNIFSCFKTTCYISFDITWFN